MTFCGSTTFIDSLEGGTRATKKRRRRLVSEYEREKPD